MSQNSKQTNSTRFDRAAMTVPTVGGRAVMSTYRRLSVMQTMASLRRVVDDPTLQARRPLYAIALMLVLAGVVLQYSLLFACGLLVLAIAAVPEVWYFFGLRALAVHRLPEVAHASFGDVVEAPLVVENRKALPMPFVELRDRFPDDIPTLGVRLGVSSAVGRADLTQTVGLWAFQRVRRRFYVRAARRGAFTFGPSVVRITDPFGVITREETIATERTLLVHPLVVPLERLGFPPLAPFGDKPSSLRLLDDPLRLAGVRGYVPGDDPRKIHWKATARMGSLQTKVLDPSTQRVLMIALDVRTFTSVQMGYDPALSELAIASAASIASWAFAQGYAVGITSNGVMSNGVMSNDDASGDQAPGSATNLSAQAQMPPRLRLEPSTRLEQLTLILDGLARLLPYNSGSLAGFLAREKRALPTGATVVYVGLESLVDVPTILALREMKARGRNVSLALTVREADDTAIPEGSQHNLHLASFQTHYLGGRARWKSLVDEAMGGAPYRNASGPLSASQRQVERALIAEHVALRVSSTRGRSRVGAEEDLDEQSRERAASPGAGGGAPATIA